jgi:rhodanese-related sulfurtransferase
MKFSKLAFVGSQFAARKSGMTTKSTIAGVLQQSPLSSLANAVLPSSSPPRSTRLFSSMGEGKPALKNVGKDAMEEIIEDYEEGGREESGYVILDVREPHEIEYTGKLSENTVTFPLQKLMQYNAFSLDEDDFEEIYGFEKPTPDESKLTNYCYHFGCRLDGYGVRYFRRPSFEKLNINRLLFFVSSCIFLCGWY